MNRVVRIGGTVLVALGVLAIVLALVSPGEPFEGLTLDTGVILLAGGLVTLGLSALTTAVETLRAFVAGEEQAIAGLGLEEAAGNLATPLSQSIAASPDGGKSRAKTREQEQAGRQEPGIGPRVVQMPKGSDDRISILKENSGPTIDSVVEEVHEFVAGPAGPQETVSEEELYVVEERTIAGKPARILSDGTVEAETDDGWMRFENVEHLEEYMDALRSQRG